MSSNQKRSNKAKPKRSPLQVAGASFVDQLGKAAVEKLKNKLGLNTEVKSIDYSTTATLTNTLANICNESSNPIAQGVTDSTREGSTCRLVRYELNGCVLNGAANLSTDTMVRIVGVRIGPVAGNYVSNATTFRSVLANGTATGFPEALSPVTIAENQEVKNTVIFDEMFALGPTGTFPTCQFFRRDLHPNELHLEWIASDTAGTNANAIGEHIAFYACASTATASNFPRVALSQRVYYVDN